MLLLVLLLCYYCSEHHAALPPGDEDELWCPKGCCLLRDPHHRSGYCGPRTQFYLCCDPSTNEPKGHPRGWGFAKDQALKPDPSLWDRVDDRPCARKDACQPKAKSLNSTARKGLYIAHSFTEQHMSTATMNGLVPMGLYIAYSLVTQRGTQNFSDMFADLKRAIVHRKGPEDTRIITKALASILFLLYLITSFHNNTQSKKDFAKMMKDLKEQVQRLVEAMPPKPLS